jgi:hypothetical protein
MKKRSKTERTALYRWLESEFKPATKKRRKKRANALATAKKGHVRRSVGKKHARDPKKGRRGIRRRG